MLRPRTRRDVREREPGPHDARTGWPASFLASVLSPDVALAAGSGAALALSFPKLGHPAVAWVALAPLLIASVQVRFGRAMLLGLLAGVIYFGGVLYWIAETMAVYGDMSVGVAVLINFGLVAYLALYCGAFAGGVAWLSRRFALAAIWLAPGWWVALEFARTYLLTGFPWALLGYSQLPVLPVAQLASVAGVYGVSGLIALVGTLLAFWVLEPRRRVRALATVPIALIVVAVTLFGAARLRRQPLVTSGAPLTVGLVQGQFPMLDRELRAGAILEHHLELSDRAAQQGARLIVWPESSLAFYFRHQPDYAARIRDFARHHRVALLVGGDDLDRDARTTRYFNAAYLLTPDGRLAMTYRKIHLVPFGEYVPLQRMLFFAKPFVQAVSDFTPGTEFAQGMVDGRRLSTAICYEIIYPALIRRFVVEGSELLTTITDDGWYGRTSAPYQHFDMAAFRAIESGRYLLRAANTGVTGIVDPYGRVLARTDLFVPAVVTGRVRFLDDRTVYAAYGDVFAWTCVALSAGAFLAALSLGRSRAPWFRTED